MASSFVIFFSHNGRWPLHWHIYTYTTRCNSLCCSFELLEVGAREGIQRENRSSAARENGWGGGLNFFLPVQPSLIKLNLHFIAGIHLLQVQDLRVQHTYERIYFFCRNAQPVLYSVPSELTRVSS